MVAQATAPPSSGASSLSSTILMTDVVIGLSMQAKNYDQSDGRSTTNETPSTSQSDCPLTLEKPTFELPSSPSKATVHQTTHNINTQASQHYSIVEDLAQSPCAMSTLEVLQSYPTQWKALLTAISGVDPSNMSLISFESNNYEPRLPPLVTFMLTIGCLGKNIFRTVLDEGTTTCIMSFSWWKSLGSPTLVSSLTMLKAYDGHVFKTHRILIALLVEIGGKTSRSM